MGIESIRLIIQEKKAIDSESTHDSTLSRNQSDSLPLVHRPKGVLLVLSAW